MWQLWRSKGNGLHLFICFQAVIMQKFFSDSLWMHLRVGECCTNLSQFLSLLTVRHMKMQEAWVRINNSRENFAEVCERINTFMFMENWNVCALSGLGCIIYVTLQHWRIVGMNWICFGFVYGANRSHSLHAEKCSVVLCQSSASVAESQPANPF